MELLNYDIRLDKEEICPITLQIPLRVNQLRVSAIKSQIDKPHTKPGPQMYRILEFVLGSFRLDSFLLTEGNRLNLAVNSLVITEGPR